MKTPSRPVLIIAAPNGARKTKKDHPALPISIEDTVSEAARCYQAGAAMLHAHVRDDAEKHCLDIPRYRELQRLMKQHVPDMLFQMTTESVGIYTPQQQAECLFALQPAYASIALREICGSGDEKDTAFGLDVFRRAADNNIHIQHILYDSSDMMKLKQLTEAGKLPQGGVHAKLVLGKYNPGFVSDPAELDSFLECGTDWLSSWTLCAFGPKERDSMLYAIANGGYARVGFENNLYLADGSLAPNTAALISQLKQSLPAGYHAASSEEARALLKTA